MDRKLLGEYLMEDRKITERQVQNALELQAMSLQGGSTPLIGTVLVAMGVANEQDVTSALQRQERDRQTSGQLPESEPEQLPEVGGNNKDSTTL